MEATKTAIIKRALAVKYGRENVSVRKCTGTASGWIDADVKTTMQKPENCTCNTMEHPEYRQCHACREAYNDLTKEAENIAREALKKEGRAFFGTYCSDDGYNQDGEQFILQIHLI